ncbi:unnamed protein product [Urochloa humidicola]
MRSGHGCVRPDFRNKRAFLVMAVLKGVSLTIVPLGAVCCVLLSRIPESGLTQPRSDEICVKKGLLGSLL